jgi:hypothetical protein
LHREHARAARGEKIIAEIPGKKFARQSIVAAKCGKNVIAPLGYEGTCDSELFLWWVETMLVPKLRKNKLSLWITPQFTKENRFGKPSKKPVVTSCINLRTLRI